jgi:hypothetical protein
MKINIDAVIIGVAIFVLIIALSHLEKCSYF